VQNILERILTVKRSQQWDWKNTAKALDLSVSMLMAVQKGERNLSDDAVFRLAQLENKLGLRVEQCATQLHTSPANTPAHTLDLSIFPAPLLEDLLSKISALIPTAGRSRGHLLQAALAITRELDARNSAPPQPKRA